MDESNYRDELQILYLDDDKCRGACGSPNAGGAIRRVDGSVVVWCLNSMCTKYRTPFGIEKARYLPKYWPNEPQSLRSRVPKRDSRFTVPFEREDYIYARDTTCVHCDVALSELAETTAALEDWRDGGREFTIAEPIALFDLPNEVLKTQLAPRAAMRNRPIRYKRPRALDHILPYWLGILIAPYLNERAVQLIGSIAVVASCPPCNSMRHVARPESQLLSKPVIDQSIASMQRLFANRILIDSDVDPVVDSYLFTLALKKMRAHLLGEDLGKLPVATVAASQ